MPVKAAAVGSLLVFEFYKSAECIRQAHCELSAEERRAGNYGVVTNVLHREDSACKRQKNYPVQLS
jgi:hypothetical protein